MLICYWISDMSVMISNRTGCAFFWIGFLLQLTNYTGIEKHQNILFDTLLYAAPLPLLGPHLRCDVGLDEGEH